VVQLLQVHPSRQDDLVVPERPLVTPSFSTEEYYDVYANHRTRIRVGAGRVRFCSEAIICDAGELDAHEPEAAQLDVSDLPVSVLKFLSPSRYCEVDSELMEFAWRTFAQTNPGWERIQTICEFVHGHLRFDYQQARSNRTAIDAFRERVGVCRDFAHLAITLCRCMNIPARYATGYLGDIGVPIAPDPMDFSAWFEVYLQDRWYSFDARHNCRRIGRILVGIGCDASDVPITTSFGEQSLDHFEVFTEEIGPTAVSRALMSEAA